MHIRPLVSPGMLLVGLVFAILSVSVGYAANARPSCIYYTNIPGVTKEEVEAIELLKRQRPEGLTYVMLYSDVSFVGVDGEIRGFTRLLCKEIGELFGIRVTPRLADWNTLAAGLDSGEFDLSGEFTPTARRRDKYRMTSPIAERTYVLFHKAGRTDFDLINGKETLRYGFLKGSINYNRVLETSAVPFTAVFLDSIGEAADAMQNGNIDAFISEGRMDSHFENYPGIAYQEYYPLIHTSVALATANPALNSLIDVYQKHLDNGGMACIAGLRAEGDTEYLRHKFLKQLSTEEKSYVKEHVENGKRIPLAAEHDNYPISFYNIRENRWQGIAHDILAEITRVSGLEFEIVTPRDATWMTVMETLERNGADMITELMPTQNRRGRFLWTQSPYTRDTYAFLSREDAPNISMHRVLGAKVGLIRGSAHEDAFRQVFPDHTNSVTYGNAMEAFEALEAGVVDMVLMTRNLLLGITIYNERPDFKVNIPLNLPSDSYFGFNNNKALLCGIIDKAQKIVDCENIADQWKRKSFDYKKKIAQARIPYLISIFVLLLVVMSLLLALSRKKEFRSRRLSMLDHLTRLPNRRQFDEQMRIEWDKSVKDRLCVSLLAIDIDHFKQFNDTYGHPQGDMVLRAIAKVLDDSMGRQTDLVARMGGEEFSVLLPNTGAEGARLVAEKIRANVEKASIENLAGGPPIGVQVSIGVASARPGPADRLEKLQALSDQALYEAKNGGRNRVCVANSP